MVIPGIMIILINILNLSSKFFFCFFYKLQHNACKFKIVIIYEII